MKKTNMFSKIWTSLKHQFIRLFGFGRHKNAINVLQEESLMSPSKMIIRNFLRNRLAMLGLFGFLLMVFLTFGITAIIPYDEKYSEGAQNYLPPNTSYLKYPKKLEKEGIRLIASSASFSVAISKQNNIYAWGSNTKNFNKKDVQKWQPIASKITQLAAGIDHIAAVVENEVTNVWRYNLLLDISSNEAQVAKDGTVWYQGNTDPLATLGENGSYYIKQESKEVFQKNQEGTWVRLDWDEKLKGESDPSDSIGKVDDYFLNTKDWRVSKKLASAKIQSLEFLGSNNHQQGQIPVWNDQVASSLSDKKEREAIARYFDTPYFEYQYVDLKRIPSFDFRVGFVGQSRTNVKIEYTIQDYDGVIVEDDVKLFYGTLSITPAYTFFTHSTTNSIPIEIPEEAKTGVPFSGEIELKGLRPGVDYQFVFGYKVYKADGTPYLTYNSSYSVAIRTEGNGKPSESFMKVRQQNSNYSKETVTLPIVGIANDPIKKIELGHNVTSILTESGRLYTWGSTSSNGNRLGNTIRNKVPIVDFTYARHHIVVLREDNSLEVYGPSSNAISLNLTQKYPYFKLNYPERMKKIAEDIKRYEDELADWEAKIPNEINQIDNLIQMAKEDLDLKTAVYQAELEKYRSVPAEFATLSRNFANAQVQLDNSRLQLDSFIFTKNDVYGRLNASYKNLVDSIDPGEEPLTGEMIHQEFLKTGTEEQWLQSDLLIYAEAVDRVLNQEASFKLAEETFQQVKEKYEAFETAEIRAQYEEILQKYIVARDNMVDAQDYLNELYANREKLYNIVDELTTAILEAEKQMTYIEKIAAITDNGIILTQENKLMIWGSTASIINKIPEEATIGEIVDLQAGLFHVVAVKSDGSFVVWGQNELNQLEVPKKLDKVDKVYVGRFHTYAVDKEGKIYAWGNKGYLFGTDSQGRSLLHRILQGGRVSMTVGAIAVLISLVIGVTTGLVAGFYGGWIDNIIMRFSEVFNSFPFLPLAITLSSVIGYRMQSDQKMYLIMVILGVLSWPGLCRLVRGQILSEREKDFVTAARALGIREKNIIIRHILPNVINVIIVNTTLSYAGSLLTEAGLSFLGFGVVPPKPSWGNLLTGAQNLSVIQEYWWLWILPALFIVVTALSINLIGDGLREAMDPKANQR